MAQLRNSHRLAVLLTALALVILPAWPSAATAEAKPRVNAGSGSQPDIVVIMTDDLGVTDDRLFDRLPHLKALFEDAGLTFTQAYSEQPLCCPGRATFLTGQHVRKHGVTYNDARLLDPSHTIATALDAAGYYTALVGKYLNHAEWLKDQSPVGWDHVAMMMGNEQTYTASPDTSQWVIDDLPVTLGYRDQAVVGKSLEVVADAPLDQPLFLWANPRAPHWGVNNKQPWMPAIEPRYVGDTRCSGIEPWKPASYSYAKQPAGFPLDDICRSMLTVDELAGELKDAFTARGTAPIWVFTSDNGMAWGQHGFPMKNNPWATRLPLHFAGPGIPAGSTSALVSNIDIGPTLANIGRTSMPWADGVSFANVVFGGTGGDAWMLEDEPTSQYTAGPWRAKWWGIREPGWHLVRIGSSKPKLYNLTNDPWELHPVCNKAKKREMKAHFPY